MGRLRGFFRLIRPLNGLMMGFAVIVGASLFIVELPSYGKVLKLLLGYITAFSLTGASMAINDYYDREIDRVNEPSRPIPSGLIKPRESLFFAAFLTAAGLIAAAFTSLPCLIIATTSWLVSATYATRGKRTGLPGNFLVSACVAIPFIYGGFLAGQGLNPKILLFSALAFLSNTGREVIKGIADVEGDKAKGIRTIAVSHGRTAAAYAGSSFYLSAVLLSILPMLFSPPLVSAWFIPPVALADAGFILSSAKILRDPSKENARKVKNMSLLWMALGLIAFFAGNL